MRKERGVEAVKNRALQVVSLILAVMVVLGCYFYKDAIRTFGRVNTKGDEIIFKDQYLQLAVKKALNKKPEPILQSELSRITELHIYGTYAGTNDEEVLNAFTKHNAGGDVSVGKITNLEDIRYFPNLVKLTVVNNQISDLTGIKDNINLEELDLTSNRIKDILYLAKLQRLRILRLSSNSIENIETLGKLSGLEVLSLGSNQIKDIRVLRNLTKLTNLQLQGNKITDISPVESLGSLEYVNATENPIENEELLMRLNEKVYVDSRLDSEAEIIVDDEE